MKRPRCAWCGVTRGAICRYPNGVYAHYNCVLYSDRWGRPVVPMLTLEAWIAAGGCHCG